MFSTSVLCSLTAMYSPLSNRRVLFAIGFPFALFRAVFSSSLASVYVNILFTVCAFDCVELKCSVVRSDLNFYVLAFITPKYVPVTVVSLSPKGVPVDCAFIAWVSVW